MPDPVEFDLTEDPPAPPEPQAPEPLTEDRLQQMMDAQAERIASMYASTATAPEPEVAVVPDNQYQYNLAMNREIADLKNDLRSMEGGRYKDAPDACFASVEAEIGKLASLEQLQAFRAAGYHKNLFKSDVIDAMNDPTVGYVPSALKTTIATNESRSQATPPPPNRIQVSPAVMENFNEVVESGHMSREEAEANMKFLAQRQRRI